MLKGEKAILRCTSEYGYGDRGSPPSIPGGASLDFEVELFGWTKDIWKMDIDEKIAEAESSKASGTVAFKAGDFKTAAREYADGMKYVWENVHADEDKDKAAEIRLSLALNAAAAQLKMGENNEAIANCDKVLEGDPANVKAIFRKGQGQFNQQDYKVAMATLKKGYELDPKNKPLISLMKKCKTQQAVDKAEEKKRMAMMMGAMVESEEDKAARFAKVEEAKAAQEALRAANPRVFFDMEMDGEPVPHKHTCAHTHRTRAHTHAAGFL